MYVFINKNIYNTDLAQRIIGEMFICELIMFIR